MKGKVIVIKQRGPASRRPRCGHAYKRTGSQQFHSGSSLRQVSHATKEAKETMGSQPLLANMLRVALLAREALGGFGQPRAFCSSPHFSRRNSRTVLVPSPQQRRSDTLIRASESRAATGRQIRPAAAS